MAKDFREEDIARAIDACYDAVLAPELWEDALARLARAFGATHTFFYPRNPDANDPNPLDPARPIQNLPASRDYKPLLGEYLAGGWHLNHYRAQRGIPLFAAGRRVLVEHDLATDEERKRLPQYNELYLKWGLPGFAVVGMSVEGRAWAVPFMRGLNQGHFSREEAERIAEIAPHLARLLLFAERFAHARAQAALDSLEGVACAAVAIDWRGLVAGANEKAHALLGADLFIAGGALTAVDRDSDRALQTLMASLRAAEPKGAPARVFVRRAVLEPDGRMRRPLVVDALPVQGVGADVFGARLAILTITDLDAAPVPLESSLRQAFGLTAAEARLAMLFSEGKTPEEAAATLGVARDTARKRLKAIYAKTATSRQADLAALLARLAGR